MSTVLIVAPIVVANWGAISAAVTAVAVTMGASAVSTGVAAGLSAASNVGKSIADKRKLDADMKRHSHRAEIELENSEILGGSTGLDQEIVIQKDGYTARFSRDTRGALKVCVEGESFSKEELRQIGEDLVGRVTQQYAYHRIMTEMKDRNMTVVHEEMDADRTVRIRVKNW